MKITAKTTKQELKNILNANVKAVKSQDKNLFDRITYTGKKAKEDDAQVSKRDLADLVKEVMNVLGDKFVTPALAEEVKPTAENSVKKLSKGVSKKQKSMEEAEVEEEKPEVSEEVEQTALSESKEAEPEVKEEKVDKKSAKKSSKGKKEPKKDDATTSKEDGIVHKDIFPDTLKVGDSEYKIAHEIATMDDLYEALSKDEEIVFAYYWTKSHLKKFSYFYNMLGTPKSFDHDLDLATTIYVSEEKKIAYAISMYTEGLYNIQPTDFEEVDGIRYASGIEFQIYRAVKP